MVDMLPWQTHSFCRITAEDDWTLTLESICGSFCVKASERAFQASAAKRQGKDQTSGCQDVFRNTLAPLGMPQKVSPTLWPNSAVRATSPVLY